MNKICIIGLLAGICGLANVANAVVVSYQNPITYGGTTTFYDGNAYEWGIQAGSGSSSQIPSGTQLSSATISFTATLSGEPNGTLYVDLLNLAPVGNDSIASISSTHITQTSGDYWTSSFSGVQSSAVSLNSLGYSFISGVQKSVAITIDSTTPTLLNYLSSDLSSLGGFDIGFTPNCHYAVSGLSFSYTTKSVPDAATTVLLLGASLLGLEIFRRKFAPAKNQA